MKICGNCREARESGREGIYCRLYGILILRRHDGCRYHSKKEGEGNDRGHRNHMDGQRRE